MFQMKSNISLDENIADNAGIRAAYFVRTFSKEHCRLINKTIMIVIIHCRHVQHE